MLHTFDNAVLKGVAERPMANIMQQNCCAYRFTFLI